MIASAVEALRSILPQAWQLTVHYAPVREVEGRLLRPDAEITIEDPNGTVANLVVESKAFTAPRDVARAAAFVARVQGGQAKNAMLVTSFVSPATRAELARHGMGWFDPTGNLRLALERPAVFIDRTGADRSEVRDPEDRTLKSLRGHAAARIVLALCETGTPVGVREAAARAGVSVASGSRVLDLLDREAVIRRRSDGTVIAVRRRALVTRWTADYQVMKANEVITSVDPRGIEHALKALPAVEPDAVLTGSAAARAYLPADVTPVSPLVSLSLYTADPIGLMDRLRLKRVERGSNVLVMRPYDDVVRERARTVGGLRCAPPAQVVADLLTGPGRSTEEAEQLMEVFATVEEGWAS
ncbi:transcriptional regulator with AbiEi antitoxin domain of type IV toxin-antitoxin system [Saccharothrix variisporea]|uniref:Transcriptional regulator with AbiEi antitoxin domain of type IV toxin-antitoxin system n=1 Tax=Saccharothrix variisporea TaxID=543527 RepID=A0A495XCB7_9PSEU|nr:transcriptional regulator with AbiEi antitoxin domain of type IV toxin-antitoxin system [Saccharothrix variisporea]